MVRNFRCIVDCRIDTELENDFLTLNLWGKPVFVYVLEEVLKCKEFADIGILTDSDYVKKIVNDYFKDTVIPVIASMTICLGVPQVLVSGRAPFLKGRTLDSAVKDYSGGVLRSVVEEKQYGYSVYGLEVSYTITRKDNLSFAVYDGVGSRISSVYRLDNKEGLVINTKNDFELALMLKKKELNATVLAESIVARIEEKKTILRNGIPGGICLVGHSQIDNWEIGTLCGCPVRNCGIRGISSFEYNEYILKKGLLDCKEDCYIVMHGTNDIVYERSFQEIARSIMQTVNYIRKRRSGSIIYFLSCITVIGRIDRDNRTIQGLNSFLKGELEDVNWIDVEVMNDEFGNLDLRYTKDGLHLSGEGYKVLKMIVEKEVGKRQYGKNSSYSS